MFDEGSQATRERYGPCPSRQMGFALQAEGMIREF